jgi:tRNA pseudouridine synthase 10
MATERMIKESVELLAAKNAESFSISTIIPKDWLVREEKVWDSRMEKGESIKNFLNRTIVSGIRKARKMDYYSDGDFRIVFDYSTGNVNLVKNDLFVFGRYRKLSAGLSQSRWKCPKCFGEGKACTYCEGKGKLYVSVEEKIGEPVKAVSSAKDYVMHASGREDVDATNSAGRAFVLEVKEPNRRKIDLAAVQIEIGASKEVEVSDLRIVGRGFVENVTESHFDKSYEAEVEFGRQITDADIAKIKELEGKTLLQETPTRVAHRRANLVRHRKVKEIDVKNINGNMATLMVKAEAGTYIKELISGDGGRTKPSIAEILSTSAVCKKLEVVKIDDEYLDFCLSA